jgi:putative two-component system response regulator
MDKTRPTILIVDDTPDNIMLLSSLLKDRYNTKVANNGSTALQIAARRRKWTWSCST